MEFDLVPLVRSFSANQSVHPVKNRMLRSALIVPVWTTQLSLCHKIRLYYASTLFLLYGKYRLPYLSNKKRIFKIVWLEPSQLKKKLYFFSVRPYKQTDRQNVSGKYRLQYLSNKKRIFKIVWSEPSEF